MPRTPTNPYGSTVVRAEVPSPSSTSLPVITSSSPGMGRLARNTTCRCCCGTRQYTVCYSTSSWTCDAWSLIGLLDGGSDAYYGSRRTRLRVKG
jgi:hypothetical protein